MAEKKTSRLRSREWFDIPGDPSATALHVERYTNFGIKADELRSGKPIIGIAEKTPFSPLTSEQLLLFEKDNISENIDKSFKNLGINPQDTLQITRNIIEN